MTDVRLRPQLEAIIDTHIAAMRAELVAALLHAQSNQPAPAPIEPTPEPGSHALASIPKSAAKFFGGEEGHGLFYDCLRSNHMLGPTITGDEFRGCDITISAFALAGAPVSYCAYGLATKYLETGGEMQPIDERGGTAYFTRLYDVRGARPKLARSMGNTQPGDGAKFHGRGDVQLTWRSNYERATKKLRALGYDVDFVAQPDLVKEPHFAAIIMVYGMLEGWFTGRKLSDDLPATGPATHAQFVASRDIINGTDKQKLIADYAIDFQTALLQGGYRPAA